ncbi:hypothetical protein [Dyadobacter sp. Leaf189]|uniref:hypothetical protein n=1 Tax=Dyadobacter sp. Leaf189 TaxID=1736295 RepID=UPI0006FAA267|nr:hypothetical protein [Dyadobacter sp. Leaf189]KQS33980.1 hypothetical protein ASG33_08085 [Dyadobacter sp. Leaf189]
MENKEDKLVDLADKKPGLALVYGMAVVIVVLAGVIPILYYTLRGAEKEARQELAQVKKDCQDREDKITAEAKTDAYKLYEKLIDQYEKKSQKDDEAILGFSKKFDAIDKKASVVNSKLSTVEKKFDSVSGTNQKIQEVIQR